MLLRLLLSVAIAMYLMLGSSQAMKTAWVEDCLSLVPPIAFLVAVRFRSKPPNEEFPYGYHRAVAITGDVITGEAYVVPKDENNQLDKLKQADDLLDCFNWRVYDVVVVPARSLKEEQLDSECRISRKET